MEKQKVLAYYFPQYHTLPENDIVFGEGFSDWNLFDKDNPALSKSPFPLEPPFGLGYYNPTELSIRKQQALLAKKYGIDGFIYYHYWLENRPFMDKVLLNLLEDNEPDMPFCFCFVNESWKHCYGSSTKKFKTFHEDGTTFRQLYDAPKEQAIFLAKFMKHPNYIRVNDLPVLFLYRLDKESSLYLDKVISHLKELGIEDIYFVANTSTWCLQSYVPEQIVRKPDAFSPFSPHIPASLPNLPQIPCGLIGWNNKPRYNHKTFIVNFSSKQIETNVTNDLLKLANDRKSPQFYVLFAWNEWAEAAIIEPNTMYGEDIGFAILRARYNVLLTKQTASEYKIKIEYGFGEKMIDVTCSVFYNCIVQRSSGEQVICIPSNDCARASIFSDPYVGVYKIIRVNYNGSTKEYDHVTPVEIILNK